MSVCYGSCSCVSLALPPLPLSQVLCAAAAADDDDDVLMTDRGKLCVCTKCQLVRGVSVELLSSQPDHQSSHDVSALCQCSIIHCLDQTTLYVRFLSLLLTKRKTYSSPILVTARWAQS